MAEAETIIPDARREESDVGEGFIWGAFALLLSSLIAIALLVLWLFPQSSLERKRHGDPTYESSARSVSC